MPKEEKVQQVAELRDDIGRATAMFLTDYRGLKVSEMAVLRRKLGESNAEYKVVKNTLFHLAAEASGEAGLGPLLEGPTAVAFAHGDPIASAKAIVEFAKDHKALGIKGGLVDAHVYNGEQVQALSRIPPRDILIAQMLGSIHAPITGFVGTLQGVLSGLVFTLQAIADQKAA